MSIPKLSETNSQVNVANSILRHYACPLFHDSYQPLDAVLDQIGDRKICLVLFDGFGKYIQKRTKSLCPFIYEHGAFDIEAVYPPTTVAATNALLSGKYPCETGFLGWTQYWKRTNEYIVTFFGTREGTNIPASITPTSILKFTTIPEILNEKFNRPVSKAIMGFNCKDQNGKQSSGIFFNDVEKAVREPDTKFIYAYWTEPDHSLHEGGIYSANTKRAIKIIDESMKLLVERNPDVVFLTIADHGHTAVKWIDIRKYPDFMETLVDGRFSIEPRLASFRVKPDKYKAFEQAFQEHFSSWFEMYTKEEVYKENIFGYGPFHKLTDEFIGDYVLIATDKYAFYDGYNECGLAWTHAGSTKEERIVELGIYNQNTQPKE